MAVREPLVAKRAPEVVDVLQAPHDAAIQVQLDRDAQVHVDVERVVVRHEWPRRGAARERLQHRRLDLREAASAQEVVDRLDHLRALEEHLARARVREQVQFAVAVARALVAHPVVAVGRGPQRLGQHRARAHRQRQLPALRHVHDARDRHDVADVEVEQRVVGLPAERLQTRHDLHRTRLVAHVEERRLRVPAARDQAPRDAVAQAVVRPRRELRRVVGRLDVRDPRARHARGDVRIGLDAIFPQALELCAAFVRVACLLSHRGR